jgi:hypothetical protein
MSIANVARLKYSGNLSSSWWTGLAIRPAWDFALSKSGELFARPGSVRVDTTAKAIDPRPSIHPSPIPLRTSPTNCAARMRTTTSVLDRSTDDEIERGPIEGRGSLT